MASKQSHQNFSEMTVVSFESRMAAPMQKLIERHGGKAIVAPSMKEIPLEDNPEVFSFYESLTEGKIDLVILMTGVGTRTLIATLEKRHPKNEVIGTLSTKTKIVVRGPKPTSVCRMNNIPIAVIVPEPNTWREIVAQLHEELLLAGKKVAVLEYGIPNIPFLDELKEAEADVVRVPVYQWALPDDLGPLNKAIDLICDGKIDLALFTTSRQVDHLLLIAAQRGRELELRRAFYHIGICSIGPVTSEKLAEHQLFPDFEVTPNKMASLVEQSAVNSPGIVAKKRRRFERWCDVRIQSNDSKGHGELVEPSPESSFLRACRRQKNKTIPVWFMRQAGRYMAEYQISRRRTDFKETCKNPDLATGITIGAVERLGVDAAIIFSDILLIVEPMGLQLDYREGTGPVIANPVRDIETIRALRPVDVEESLGFLLEAIRKTRSSLHSKIPLIGFAGAPFTVASYMIEGRGSKNYIPTKTLMHNEPKTWHLLMRKITQATTDLLNAQINAGAQVIQIFDSWVGTLHPKDYAEFILPHSRKLIRGIRKGTPVIHFGSFHASMLDLQKRAGGDVLSLDWRVDIGSARKQVGSTVAIQGNLDPVLLFGNQKMLLKEAKKILTAVASKPGFIFNLGHGILPETPVDNVMALVDFVHEWKID